MKDYLKFIGALAVLALTITLFWLFLLPLFAAGKVANREAQKFDAETSAQVYDNSRQYQQGVNRDLARYCREYREAEGAGREAVAELIRTTADTYQGPLTPANQTCLEEIN